MIATYATSGFLTAPECTKFVFGRGSAPGPTGGAYDALPDPVVGWGGGKFPTPRRLRHLCYPPPTLKSGYATED